jgi:hypothetical protein
MKCHSWLYVDFVDRKQDNNDLPPTSMASPALGLDSDMSGFVQTPALAFQNSLVDADKSPDRIDYQTLQSFPHCIPRLKYKP